MKKDSYHGTIPRVQWFWRMTEKYLLHLSIIVSNRRACVCSSYGNESVRLQTRGSTPRSY